MFVLCSYCKNMAQTQLNEKITVLAKYLKETGFMHQRNKNISTELKQKIYEAYYEKAKNQSINKFCEYLNEF